MTKRRKNIVALAALYLLIGLFSFVLQTAQPVVAQVTNPQTAPLGAEGIVPSTPPLEGATISLPNDGQEFTESVITVSGLCPDDLLVKLFKNEVFGGSTECVNGSWTLEVDLFGGFNNLIARVFDDLDQPGPDSNTVSVRFQEVTPEEVEKVTVTTNFAKRGAFPGESLTWPITIANGQPPYAVDIDWGDGQSDLISREFPGQFLIDHVYESPGSYRVVIQITDSLGTKTFIQLVAISNGPVQARVDEAGGTGEAGTISERTVFRVIVWPLYVLLVLIVSTFWLGRRYEIHRLRRRLANNQPLKF